MKLYFHFLSGTRQDQVIELHAPEGAVLRIGRDPGADLPFNAEFEYPVSRQHATIEHKGGKIILRDVGSSLGTTVQGQRIEAGKGIVLKSTYRLQFGGEVGPLCRFYKEQDLKRCPLCDGPLFKNNFTCVFCHRRVCFTHFDDTHKGCSECADAKRAALREARHAEQPAPPTAAQAPPPRSSPAGAAPRAPTPAPPPVPHASYPNPPVYPPHPAYPQQQQAYPPQQAYPQQQQQAYPQHGFGPPGYPPGGFPPPGAGPTGGYPAAPFAPPAWPPLPPPPPHAG